MATRQHILRLAALLGLSAVIQAWVIAHAIVPAQDSIRYLAAAQAMQQRGWRSAVAAASDPPAYPTLVYGCHALLSAVSGVVELAPERLLWLRSLQLAAALPLILSLIPLYVLLTRWAGPRAAAYGGLLFCVTSSAARLGADGVSDSLQLLSIIAALAGLSIFLGQAADAQQQRQPKPQVPLRTAGCLLAVGVALGCGMLAGSIPPAALLAVTSAILLDRGQADALHRHAARRYGRRLAQAALVAVGLASVVAPYALATAGVNSSALASRLRGDHRTEHAARLNFVANNQPVVGADTVVVQSPPSDWQLSSGEPMAFGHKESGVSLRRRGLIAAIVAYARQLGILLGAPLIVLAALGALRGERNSPRFDRFFLQLSIVYSAIAIVHAARSGYLSDRHLLPLLPLALAWGGRGVFALGVELQRQLPWATAWAEAWPRAPAAIWFSRCAVFLAIVVSLAFTARPLHGSRWAHRQAAEWLASTMRDDGAVLDTRGWTALYSGRPTYRHEAAGAALADGRLAYVVVDERELSVDSPRARTLRELLSRSAEPAVSFASGRGSSDAAVSLYRWRPERFARQIASPTEPQ